MGYTLQFHDVLINYDYFTEGLKYTVYLTVVGMLIAVVLGTVTAAARGSNNKFISAIATCYVEAFRNTPLLIQLWLIYFGLGQIGIQFSALTAGLCALAVNTGAYTAEIIRAGFESVDREIREAAIALGFTPWLSFRKIIMPLGFRAVMPALCNMTIQCLLASALVSVLGVNELTNQAMRLSSKTFRTLESFILIGVLYIILTLTITGLFNLWTRKISRGSLH